MSLATTLRAEPRSGIDKLWYTRCAVPTASGIALKLGWLAERYARDRVEIGVLQEAPLEIARHHYDHRLVGLLREGGNVPALAARSSGSPTRLVGLTWIDEQQTIVARADGRITGAQDLAGARIAIPARTEDRETSMAHAMALHGFANALAIAGLNLDAVEIIPIPLGRIVPPGHLREPGSEGRWPGLDLVAQGGADAAYIKGAAAAEAALAAGLVVAVDLDAQPYRRRRVNNGTPRPLTVHSRLLEERPDWVVAFLAETLRAADWAATNPAATRGLLAGETAATAEGVQQAYGESFHRALHPDLSPERVELLGIQKDFLLHHGLLAGDVDIERWIDPEPLRAATTLNTASSMKQQTVDSLSVASDQDFAAPNR